MSNVERRFDAVTRRWFLSSLERVAVTPFTELSPGVWASLDSSDRVAECLIAEDAAGTVPREIRELIEAELGWIPGEPTGAELDIARAGDDLPVTTTIHEPGIPYVDGSGSVLVPTDAGTVRVSISNSVLMIDVPVQSTHEWVRVSDASSGHVLALGRVQRFGDGFGANVTFALDGSDIHIALTDTPLDPVADRRTRRSQWLDDVLSDLWRQWWRHPWRTRDSARDAMNVARSLGDSAREARARRFARIIPAAFAVSVLVTVAAVTTAFVSLLPSHGTQLVVTGPTSAVYDFEGKGSVTVSAGVNSDGTLGLVMSDTLVGMQRFGPGNGGTEIHRAACRDSKNIPLASGIIPAVSAKYVVSLRSDDKQSVLLGAVEMSSEATTFSSSDESCNAAPPAADGSITALVTYQRSTEEFSLPGPSASLGNSRNWTLAIERVSPDAVAIDGTTRAPVVLGTNG